MVSVASRRILSRPAAGDRPLRSRFWTVTRVWETGRGTEGWGGLRTKWASQAGRWLRSPPVSAKTFGWPRGIRGHDPGRGGPARQRTCEAGIHLGPQAPYSAGKQGLPECPACGHLGHGAVGFHAPSEPHGQEASERW